MNPKGPPGQAYIEEHFSHDSMVILFQEPMGESWRASKQITNIEKVEFPELEIWNTHCAADLCM